MPHWTKGKRHHLLTLLVKPTSLPQKRAAIATPTAKSVTLMTGPMMVGMMDDLRTRISGIQEILDNYADYMSSQNPKLAGMI